MNTYIYLIFIASFLTVFCYDDNSTTYYGSGGGGVSLFIIAICICACRRRRSNEQPVPVAEYTNDGQPVYPIATPILPGSYSGSGEYRGQIISLPDQQPSGSSMTTRDAPPPYSAAYYKAASSASAGPQSSHASNVSTQSKPASIYSTGTHSSHASDVRVWNKASVGSSRAVRRDLKYTSAPLTATRSSTLTIVSETPAAHKTTSAPSKYKYGV